MTAVCTSSSVQKLKNNNSKFNNNTREMSVSPYSRILHDPECQSGCCASNFVQPMEESNFYHVKNIDDASKYYSYEIPVTSSFTITSNGQEPEVQDVVDYLETGIHGYPRSCYWKPSEKIPYRYRSTSKLNSAEAERSQRSCCKGVTKRKRKRTVFTTEQIILMEGVFKKRPYVSKEERLFLTHKLNISEKAIKIWFQNRRRVTEKRDQDHADSCNSDSTVEEGHNDYMSRLDYIESQIKQNTDQFGYVTLDSKTITELVKLIDIVLSNGMDCPNDLYKSKMTQEKNASYIMYEPISPVSLTDDHKDSKDNLKWELLKPEESLQRLIDIQSILFS